MTAPRLAIVVWLTLIAGCLTFWAFAVALVLGQIEVAL